MNVHPLIKKIVDRKLQCFFISPHLDDAVFSAGSFISFLASKTSVTIITITTRGCSPPYTLSAWRNIRMCGYKNAYGLFRDRRKEDSIVCRKIGVECIHLDFVDALWRKKDTNSKVFRNLGSIIPEFIHYYPIHRLHIQTNKIASCDPLLNKLKKKLKKIISNNIPVYIFCPLAIDTHIDHIITRTACESLNFPIIYWLDFPYYQTVSQKVKAYIKNMKLVSFTWHTNYVRKKEVLELYSSQLKPIFPQGIKNLPVERFYYSADK